MEQNTHGSSEPTRLDRIDRIIEILATTQIDMQPDLKILLKAQVVMGEQMVQLAEAQKRTEERLQHTDARMDALIFTVDEIVRGGKR